MHGSLSRIASLLVACLLAGGCASSKQVNGGDAGHDRLYVANQGEASVSVIDMSTNEVVDTVDLQKLGYSATPKPHHIAVEPDGSFWYVSLIGENKVLKFTRADKLVATADFVVPGMLALNPTNDELYVARSMSAVNPPTSIGVISRTSMASDEIDVFFPRPHALAVMRDGTHAFTASLAENSLMSVNTATHETALSTVDGATQTFVQFAISPDGKKMVTGGQVSGKVLIFDISNPDKPVVTNTIDVNAQPWHPVFSADGRFAYFGNKKTNTITVIDVAAGKISAVIEDSRIAQPHGTAISADGRYLYISNQHADMGDMSNMSGMMHHRNGTVLVVDTSTNTVIKEINVGAMPSGIGTRTRK